jgi:hypothetical protein
MTTTKSLSRLLLGVALAGASGLALSAGGAKAVQICTFPATECGPITVTDKIFTVLQLPTVGAGQVEFQFDPGILLPGSTYPGIHTVDVDFTPDLLGPIVNATFDYKIDITSGYFFDVVGLAWNDLSTAGVTVQKEVFSDAFTTSVLKLTTDDELGDISSLGLKSIWVRDTYNVPAQSALDDFSNSYSQVPGPLPLLGAGAAFGFSRRLRRRIKQRHCLG